MDVLFVVLVDILLAMYCCVIVEFSRQFLKTLQDVSNIRQYYIPVLPYVME